jgi:ribosomal-protein-alanine N-acetyltransferase
MCLRAPRPGDEHAAHARWARDPAVQRFLEWQPHEQLGQTRAQLEWDQARWLKGSAWTWLLVDRAAHAPGGPAAEPFGMVQLVPQRLERPAHHLRLGYLLARSHWGRGLMREAVAAVLRQAYAQPAVWRVDALCDLDNVASQRVLEALGFEREGTLRRHSLHPNLGSEPRDVALYASVRPTGG